MGPDNVEMFSESSENQGSDGALEPESTEAISRGEHTKQPVGKTAAAAPEGPVHEPPAGEESAERYREGTARDWRDAGTKKATGDTEDPASPPGPSTKPGAGEAKSRETETFRDGTARDWREGQVPDEDESSTSKETRWR